jgi:hypothetical protein
VTGQKARVCWHAGKLENEKEFEKQDWATREHRRNDFGPAREK